MLRLREDCWKGCTTEYEGPTPSGAQALSHPGDTRELSSGFLLSQNYPNPFNSSTRVEYTIPVASRIYFTFFDEGLNHPGTHGMEFNASRMSTGVYYYRMTADPQNKLEGTQSYRLMRRLVLIK
jgi:hypothetical protein